MKLIRVLSLSLLVIAYGMPLSVQAQTGLETFQLPECRTGEVCRVNIESVLRERYRLRLQTDARTQVFRWSLADGELPPGIVLRAGGTIVGMPRTARAEAYHFRVKVVSASGTEEPLILDMNLPVVSPRVRLVQVNATKLVALDARANDSGQDDTSDAERRAAKRAAVSFTGLDTSFGSTEQSDTSNAGGPRDDGRDTTSRNLLSNPTAAADLVATGSGNIASPIRAASAFQITPTPPCNTGVMPAPLAASGKGIFFLDARNGNLTENGALVTSGRRFKKGERITLVVDNKNPYLYTYRYTATATPTVESALNTFVPLIVGKLGELSPPPATTPAPGLTPGVERTPTGEVKAATPAPACTPAIAIVNRLETDVNEAVRVRNLTRGDLDTQRTRSRTLTDEYNRARIPLFSPNQTRSDLYQASTNLVNVVNRNIGGSAGVDPATLDDIDARLDDLKRRAARFKSRIESIRDANPNCLPLISEKLRWAGENADEIETLASSFKVLVGQIRQNLNEAVEGRNAAWRVLCNPNAFFDERAVGGFETTNDVAVSLEVTPRQGVTEAQAVSGSPFSSKFTFGGAPFFTVSGGLIFSPLRKREYVRVQGFERDQQGELVLKDGKPNLTTVIGLKENSPTRITPAIFLNGRLRDFNNPIFDAVHMSLGITAKNDNQGTDVEFLIGPSVSMLDGNMFFTVGGFAGRQQRLAGNLFEGFAVPTGVDEIPIQKNYRWNIGFALNYKLPVTK